MSVRASSRALSYFSPVVISFQAIRAILLANATAASFGGLRFICGRPPWHKSFVRFDRIACVHMSGLLVRLVGRSPRWFPRREFQSTTRPCLADGSHGL